MTKDTLYKNQKLLIRGLIVLTGTLIWLGLVQPVSAETCSWKEFTEVSNQVSGGCLANEVSGTACSGTKPTGNSSNNIINGYICCCQATEPYVAPAPKFVMPEWQIPIDTITLSKPDCVNSDQTYSGNCKIPWIAEYISGIYNYGLSVAGILAAIMLMAGGALWLISGGDASKVTQAKELITGSITGLVILASSYIILVQINPQLVQLQSIGVGTITNIQPAPADTAVFSSQCKAQTSGPCAVSNMSIFGDKANQASAICFAESGGNPNAHNLLTACTNGGYAVWGLFQFNLSANTLSDGLGNTVDCPKAFDKVWKNSSPSCTVNDRPLYDKCVALATNPQLIIINAYNLSWGKKGRGWGPWETNSKLCHF